MTPWMMSAVTAPAVWGSLPNWLTLLAVAGVAWVLLKGGSGQAIEGLQRTNQELARQIEVLQQDVKRLTAENAELRGRTDVKLATEPLSLVMREHERNAEARSVRILKVLGLIADRLGKDEET